VITAPGWREAYEQWTAGGWNALAASAEHGAWACSAAQCRLHGNMEWREHGFRALPLLGHGAIEAIEAHASDALKEIYLHS